MPNPTLNSYLECYLALSLILTCPTWPSTHIWDAPGFYATTQSNTTSTEHNMLTYNRQQTYTYNHAEKITGIPTDIQD